LDSTLTTSIDTAETAYSNMMSVDTVKAATDLSTMETILTASLTMAGKISNMSIINFI
jgi:flagellin-like hook-associated protein FlgL